MIFSIGFLLFAWALLCYSFGVRPAKTGWDWRDWMVNVPTLIGLFLMTLSVVILLVQFFWGFMP